MRRVEQFRTGDIASLPGRREVQPETVALLAQSITSMGLQTPITVRVINDFVDEDGVVVDGQPVLVTGAHRLAAAKSLGWEKIECFVMDDGDEIDARLWEISENLHRAELSALDRAQHIAEWVRLTDERRRVSGQVAQKPKGGRPESGLSAASREIGIERRAARRAIKIDALPEEAKREAHNLGLDDNQSALLAATQSQDPVAELRRFKHLKESQANAKQQREHDKAIKSVVCEEFAGWLYARIAPSELATLVYWIEASKPKDLIAAIRRLAA